ncbi:hypothetical protein SOVF_193630 [Spinacia oleracea]|nr:hypothetical protein SOVF_193630 [Spinacia oleracea]
MATSKAFVLVILFAATLLISSDNVSARELVHPNSTPQTHASTAGYDGSSPHHSYDDDPTQEPIFPPPTHKKKKTHG